MNLMYQSSRTMRLLTILLAIAGLASPAWSQTNTLQVRKLSLEDCIAISVQHNFDVQIRRYDPDIARLTLNIDYGTYDPTISVTGGHDYNRSAGGFDAQGRPFGGIETDDNRLSAGLFGALPWGLSYSLSGSLTDTYGTRPGSVVDTNNVSFFTNTVFDVLGNPAGSIVTPSFNTIQARLPFENVAGSIGFLQLRQPLLKNFWTDNTRLQIYLDKKNLKISELDLRAQVITTVTDVETAYYNLLFAQESVKVQQKALELANRLVAENKKRVEVGALAPLDEKQAESQAAASRADGKTPSLGTKRTAGGNSRRFFYLRPNALLKA